MTSESHSTFVPSSVPGNAPHTAKEMVVGLMERIFGHNSEYGMGFALPIAQRLQLTEVSLGSKADEPSREEWKVVLEIIVDEDMLNGGGNMHGGCTAFLIDICTSLVLAAGDRAGTVSQAINTVYHAPAPMGCKLRIVNTSMTIGARISSARCEIWDATNKRLVATGIHMKMVPSFPKL